MYQTRFYEGAYLLGVLAGKMAKSNTLGFVGSFPIPEVIRNINAFTLGAQSVNPAIKTKVIWVNTWYDPGKERQAAESWWPKAPTSLRRTPIRPQTVQVAQEKGVLRLRLGFRHGQVRTQARPFGEHRQLGRLLFREVKRVLDGTWKPDETHWGIKEGLVVMGLLNAVGTGRRG